MADFGRIGLSVATGLVPVMNPLFLPIHMAIFTVLIIILLVYGFTLRSSLVIAWLVPAALGAAVAYGAFGLFSKAANKAFQDKGRRDNGQSGPAIEDSTPRIEFYEERGGLNDAQMDSDKPLELGVAQ